MSKKIELCHHCGAKIVEYPHVLNKPMIEAFKELAHANGGRANLQDLSLTKNQYTNFQKLKYWGIVESCHENGEWQVTDLGWQFFRGDGGLRRKVYTYRNKIVEFEGETVSILSFLPYEYFHTEDYIDLSRSHYRKPHRELFS